MKRSMGTQSPAHRWRQSQGPTSSSYGKVFNLLVFICLNFVAVTIPPNIDKQEEENRADCGFVTKLFVNKH